MKKGTSAYCEEERADADIYEKDVLLDRLLQVIGAMFMADEPPEDDALSKTFYRQEFFDLRFDSKFRYCGVPRGCVLFS